MADLEESTVLIEMIRVDEASRFILESINPLPSEEVELSEALDRVSAKDICTPIDVPQLDNSAMDGYAVRASDICGASRTDPGILDVIDDIKAGYVTSRSVGKGQAARIMTGAVVPQGADTVVMVEKTEKMDRQKVKIFEEAAKAQNILGMKIIEASYVLLELATCFAWSVRRKGQNPGGAQATVGRCSRLAVRFPA